MTQLRNMMLEELQRRNYSQTTVKAYIRAVKAFADYFHQPPDQLGPEHIRTYQVYLLKEKKLGVRTVGHETAALRFFFCKTLKRAYPVEEVAYPKAPRRLPTILTQGEAVRLIDSASNLFHRAMLMTVYSTGTIDSLSDVRPAVARAFSSQRPYLLNVNIRGVRSPFTEWQIMGKKKPG